MSDPGSPWQNTWSESFFSRFKMEFGSFNRFETLGELLENIFSYMHYFNTTRIQTRLKMSPYQYKQKYSESVLENGVLDTNTSETDIRYYTPRFVRCLIIWDSPHSTIRYFLILSSCVLLSLHQNYNP